MALDLVALLALITAFTPIIDQVIVWIERLLKSAPGPQKKEAAFKTINALLPASTLSIPEIADVVSKSIDQMVAVYNQAGRFKHKASTKK